MIRALILDLDNCLAAANEVGDELFAPAFDAISRANDGSHSAESLKLAFADMWRHPLDWVAAKHGLSDGMLEAGRRVFCTLEVTRPMHGYGDLAILSELQVQRFLVTSGFRRLQESKIRALKLGPHFTAIHVDAIDEQDRLGKHGVFRKILREHRLSPSEVLVVGDSADSEIEAGNRLGMTTVQTLRPGVPPTSAATLHIHSLADLKALLTATNS